MQIFIDINSEPGRVFFINIIGITDTICTTDITAGITDTIDATGYYCWHC